jgi:adenosine 3'-phospho 5'-phosphosulfate transporter B3
MASGGIGGMKETRPVEFLCYDLSVYSKTTQFILLTTLTFVFFLVYGFLQELLYKLPGFEDHSTFLTLIQFFFYSIFAVIESFLRKNFERK